MSKVYGQVIRMQLQTSATDLTSPAIGLTYFNSASLVAKWYTGAAWKTAVDTDSTQTLSFKTLDGATVITSLDLADTAPVRFFESTANGSNKVIVRAPVNLAADYSLVLPTAQASANQFLRNDGSGNLEWASAAGGSGRNYLSDWNDATRLVGTIVNSLTATGNRTSSQSQWGASATSDLTISNNSTSPLRELGDYLIDSSTTTSGAFVESPLFTLDTVDLNKPLVVSFDITGVATDGNYDVVMIRYNSSGTYQETISVAGNASSGTPASAKLPTGTTTFKGFFVSGSTATDRYALRIRKTAAVNDDFQIDSLFVGPQSLSAGVAMTDWQSYTPTLGGGGTTSTVSFKWRRVGQNIEIAGKLIYSSVAGGTTLIVGLPSGLTWDTTAVTDTAFQNQYGVASVYSFSSNLTQPNKYAVALETGSSSSGFVLAQNVAGTPRFRVSDLSNNDALEILAAIPISQWQSNVTMADRAVEEYAFSTATTTTAGASDLVSFANGPQGVNFRAIDSGTTSSSYTIYRVRFQTPILPTDYIILEFNIDGNTWAPVGSSGSLMLNGDQGNASIGMSYARVSGSSTDIDVRFGNAGRNNGSTYGSTGGAWSSITTWKWRVRKVSGGAAVGYPVSARNIVGDTSGTAVPSGYIGQVITGSTGSVSLTNAASRTSMGTAVSLTPGTWMLISSMSWGTSTSTSFSRMASFLYNVTTASEFGTGLITDRASSDSASPINSITPQILTIATNTNVGFSSSATWAAGTVSFNGTIVAVRIA